MPTRPRLITALLSLLLALSLAGPPLLAQDEEPPPPAEDIPADEASPPDAITDEAPPPDAVTDEEAPPPEGDAEPAAPPDGVTDEEAPPEDSGEAPPEGEGEDPAPTVDAAPAPVNGQPMAYGGFTNLPPEPSDHDAVEISAIALTGTGVVAMVIGGVLWAEDFETAGPITLSLGATASLTAAILFFYSTQGDASAPAEADPSAAPQAPDDDPGDAPLVVPDISFAPGGGSTLGLRIFW